MENQDTLCVKVYDGEGDDARLIFEGTVRQWEIFRASLGWDIVPKKKTAQDLGED